MIEMLFGIAFGIMFIVTTCVSLYKICAVVGNAMPDVMDPYLIEKEIRKEELETKKLEARRK